MNKALLIAGVIFWILVIYNIIIIIILRVSLKKINAKENKIINTFFDKVNKIPALVEIMRRYTNHPDIFEDIIYLHKLWIIYNIKNIYDILELNYRIHREYQFLMKLSIKIPELHKNGNFLYIRNFIIFYEKDLEKEINNISNDFTKYNWLIKLKNLSIVWMIIPFDDKIVL